MRGFLFFISLFFSIALYSQSPQFFIRIYTGNHISSLVFTPVTGDYEIYSDTVNIFNAVKNNILQFTVEDDSIKLNNSSKKYFSLHIIPKNPTTSFRIKPIAPDLKARVYDDGIELTIVNSFFNIINKIDIENYTAGVVQSEVGKMNTMELNKVQVIIARTYALSNLRRHEQEGFNLCDNVHCQFYRGKSYTTNIIKADEETTGLVIVDDSIRVINAAFHSNCGGQTANSEDVWSKSVSYLRSVKDTFCIYQQNAQWEKKYIEDGWLKYLSSKKYPLDDSILKNRAMNFSQQNRKTNFVSDSLLLPLKNIREDLKLKSAFFSVEEKNGTIFLIGKGFGHGVGLCQEGAMRMSQLGYSYSDILHFYYTNIHLVNLSELIFFKEN